MGTGSQQPAEDVCMWGYSLWRKPSSRASYGGNSVQQHPTSEVPGAPWSRQELRDLGQTSRGRGVNGSPRVSSHQLGLVIKLQVLDGLVGLEAVL